MLSKCPEMSLILPVATPRHHSLHHPYLTAAENVHQIQEATPVSRDLLTRNLHPGALVFPYASLSHDGATWKGSLTTEPTIQCAFGTMRVDQIASDCHYSENNVAGIGPNVLIRGPLAFVQMSFTISKSSRRSVVYFAGKTPTES